MQTSPHLHFRGNCREAFQSYADTFGGQFLLGCDVPGDRYRSPQGFNVMTAVEKPVKAERIFKALAQGGSITMPFGETFWAHRFGMCTDRFGIPWMINCEKPLADLPRAAAQSA
jgi:PhnB protein